MHKQELIQRYFQRKDQLVVSNDIYREHLEGLFQWMINADHINNDISVKALHIKGKGSATIIAKQAGVIAGIEEVMYLVQNDTNLSMHPHVHDGSLVSSGESIFSISGNYVTLLAYERVIVNILGRMSGIATSCRDVINLPAGRQGRVSTNSIHPLIAATRKTPWMSLDKKAVAVGGGLTHRLHLADWPMIKDNHLTIVGVSPLPEVIQHMIHESVPFFEIEVETIVQAETAINIFQEAKNKSTATAMAIMLDNFDCRDVRSNLSTLENHQNIIFEASGNIRKEHIADWATTGVDIISLGSLTHSSPNFDLSMKFV